MRIEFYKHNIGKREKKEILKALDSKFLTLSKSTADFEGRFSEYLGTKYCIALSSCTGALHLALIALGVGKGDEVITTPLTFVATANSILQAGAKPVFVDVDRDTGLLDLDMAIKKISRRTKAIIPVHLYGVMCDMRKVKGIAEKYGLKVIEDAAHCIEGSRERIRPGRLSSCACFSFYATKNITCGEGGALATNNKELAERICRLRLHGISKDSYTRYLRGEKKWDMDMLGWKYTLPDILASLLLPQLDRIDALWEKRRKIYNIYIEQLGGIKNVRMMKVPHDTKNSYHIFSILVDNRDAVSAALQKRGIETGIYYKPVHLLRFYRRNFGFQKGDFINAEYIGRKNIGLPIYPSLSEREVLVVTKSLKQILKNPPISSTNADYI